jgi:pentatricopeptide repeat protein
LTDRAAERIGVHLDRALRSQATDKVHELMQQAMDEFGDGAHYDIACKLLTLGNASQYSRSLAHLIRQSLATATATPDNEKRYNALVHSVYHMFSNECKANQPNENQRRELQTEEYKYVGRSKSRRQLVARNHQQPNTEEQEVQPSWPMVKALRCMTELLNGMAARGIALSPSGLMRALSVIRRGWFREKEPLVELLHHRLHQLLHDRESFAQHMAFFRNVRGHDSIEHTLLDSRKFEDVANSLLMMKQAQKAQQAQQLMLDMLRAGVPASARSFAIVLRATVMQAQSDEQVRAAISASFEQFDEAMAAASRERYTHDDTSGAMLINTSLVHTTVRQLLMREFEGAAMWFLDMVVQMAHAKPLSAAALEPLIRHLCYSSRPEDAMAAMHRYASTIEPDSITYNTLVRALVRAEKYEHALELVTNMLAKGNKPDPMLFSSSIELLMRMRLYDDARKLATTAQRLLDNTQSILATLLHLPACHRPLSDPDAIDGFFRHVTATLDLYEQLHSTPSGLQLRSLIESLHSNHCEQQFDIIKRCAHLGTPIQFETMHRLLKNLCSVPHNWTPDIDSPYFRYIESLGYPVANNELALVLVNFPDSSGDAVRDWAFAFSKRWKFELNYSNYYKLVRVYVANADLQSAFALVQTMLDNKVKAIQYTMSLSLLVACELHLLPQRMQGRFGNLNHKLQAAKQSIGNSNHNLNNTHPSPNNTHPNPNNTTDSDNNFARTPLQSPSDRPNFADRSREDQERLLAYGNVLEQLWWQSDNLNADTLGKMVSYLNFIGRYEAASQVLLKRKNDGIQLEENNLLALGIPVLVGLARNNQYEQVQELASNIAEQLTTNGWCRLLGSLQVARHPKLLQTIMSCAKLSSVRCYELALPAVYKSVNDMARVIPWLQRDSNALKGRVVQFLTHAATVRNDTDGLTILQQFQIQQKQLEQQQPPPPPKPQAL